MPFPKRLKKWCVRLFLFGVVCFILGVLVHFQITRHSAQEIKAHVAKMQAVGRAMRMDDFTQEKIAPEDDAGAVMTELSNMRLEESYFSIDFKVFHLPLRILARDNPSSLTLAQRDLFLRFYNDNPQFWEMWKKLAACKRIQLPDGTNSEKSDWICSSERYYSSEARLTHNFLIMTANVLAVEGRVDEAIMLWTLILKTGRLLLNEGLGFSSYSDGHYFWLLFYNSIHNTSFQMHQANPEQCHRLIDVLDTDGVRKGMKHAFEIERVADWEHISVYVRAATPFLSLDKSMEEKFSRNRNIFGRNVQRGAFFIVCPLYQKELLEVDKGWLKWQSVFEEGEPWEWERQIEEQALSTGSRSALWELFQYESDPRSTKAVRRTQEVEAISAVLRLALASRIWQTENGAWPERLDQLAPGILESIPLDPFTGEPFLYQVSEKGFLIESAGKQGMRNGKVKPIRWAEVTPSLVEEDER